MIRRIFRNWVYFLNYLWILTGIFAVATLIKLLEKANENRLSLANNRATLEMLESTRTAESFALFGMIIFLVSSRRKLKRGIIRRLGVRWYRVLIGAIIPIAIPLFLMRDIERLAQAPRNQSINKESIRAFKVSRVPVLWPILVFILAQVESPLNNALLGITYVTKGTAAINDPKRYAFKWIQPEIFTDALDKYTKYIWIGSVAYCIMIILISVVSWLLLEKCSRITRRAIG